MARGDRRRIARWRGVTKPSAGPAAGRTIAGRVIAGRARGIRLASAGEGVRPLGDRLKEALFAILEPELRGAAVLDLFAGSGAGGIEALSRGAASATFVERDGRAVGAIERNIAATHLAGPAAIVVRADVATWLRTSVAGPYDVVLVDPPYGQPDVLRAAIEAIARAGRPPQAGSILREGGVVVAKHATRADLQAQVGLLASVRDRRVGDSELTFYRWSTPEAG
jgi:16S rRNA (guanine966-N2)-methyltransferase